jgi:hypothetical protein
MNQLSLFKDFDGYSPKPAFRLARCHFSRIHCLAGYIFQSGGMICFPAFPKNVRKEDLGLKDFARFAVAKKVHFQQEFLLDDPPSALKDRTVYRTEKPTVPGHLEFKSCYSLKA